MFVLYQDKLQNRTGSEAISSTEYASLNTGSKKTTVQIKKTTMGARATDSARLMKFTKELSEPTLFIGTLYSTLVFVYRVL